MTYRPSNISCKRLLSDVYLLSHKYSNAALRARISGLSLIAANNALKRVSELEATLFDTFVNDFNSDGSLKISRFTPCLFAQSIMNLSTAGAIVMRY